MGIFQGVTFYQTLNKKRCGDSKKREGRSERRLVSTARQLVCLVTG